MRSRGDGTWDCGYNPVPARPGGGSGGSMKNDMWPRRSLMSGLGASVAAFVFGSKSAAAQTPPRGFQPARHPQDEWFDKLPGKHRIFIDVISATGTGEAVAFANNL